MAVYPSRRGIFWLALCVPVALLFAVLIPAYAGLAVIPLLTVIALMLLDIRRIPAIGEFEIEIVEPPALAVGRSGTLSITIRPLSGKPATPIELAVGTNEMLSVVTDGPSFVDTAAEEGIDIAIRGERRGVGMIESVWLRWGSVIGLMMRQHRIDCGLEVSIFPQMKPVYQDELKAAVTSSALFGTKTVRMRGEGSEYSALREYVAGTDPRSIDWKRSARYRTLLAKEFEAERNQQVILAFDTGNLMCEPLDGLAKLDHAINAAALLTHACLRGGDRIGLIAFDSTVRVFSAAAAGMASYQAIAAHFARLNYSQEQTNFTLATRHLLDRLQRRSLIVMFTDFVDTVSAELMRDNLRRLARRHMVIFTSIRDPYLARLQETFPQNMDTIARIVIGGEISDDRRKLFLALEQAGIRCLQPKSGFIGPAIVNEYLDIKNRELI